MVYRVLEQGQPGQANIDEVDNALFDCIDWSQAAESDHVLDPVPELDQSLDQALTSAAIDPPAIDNIASGHVRNPLSDDDFYCDFLGHIDNNLDEPAADTSSNAAAINTADNIAAMNTVDCNGDLLADIHQTGQLQLGQSEMAPVYGYPSTVFDYFVFDDPFSDFAVAVGNSAPTYSTVGSSAAVSNLAHMNYLVDNYADMGNVDKNGQQAHDVQSEGRVDTGLLTPVNTDIPSVAPPTTPNNTAVMKGRKSQNAKTKKALSPLSPHSSSGVTKTTPKKRGRPRKVASHEEVDKVGNFEMVNSTMAWDNKPNEHQQETVPEGKRRNGKFKPVCDRDGNAITKKAKYAYEESSSS